ncbi:MAG: alpha/beta fold hydrolase [Pseudomonadota bacterium]
MSEKTEIALRFGGSQDASVTIVLAHGAGAAMDSDFMNMMSDGLVAHGYRVARFEFPYMAKTRQDGRKRAPDRAAVLQDCWRDVVAQIGHPERLVIGGKSMGGRVASMMADELGVMGLVCLGYPFHPPAKPETLRVAHLKTLRTPALICHGTRDPFGKPDEVTGYGLSPAILLHWVADGDHDFVPRQKSGHDQAGNIIACAAAVDHFLRPLSE